MDFRKIKISENKQCSMLIDYSGSFRVVHDNEVYIYLGLVKIYANRYMKGS